jgi:RNA polymerase sigma factor (sigma-70 family)
VLGNSADAHDAFQATFLVLIRRAESIRQRNSVQSWLFGVTRRVAAQVKIDAAKRRRIEQQAAAPRVVNSHDEEGEELRLIVAEELARLPEKYRAPVLLCDMEGLSYDAAARRLGCPAGTVGIRLMRARNRLRGRLTRRGIVLSSVAMAAWIGSQKSHAGVPSQLVAAVVDAATQRTTVSATSMVAGLAERTLRGRFVFRATIAAGLLVAASAALTFALAFTPARKSLPNQTPGATGPGSQLAPAQAAIPGTIYFRIVEQQTRKPLEGVNVKVWVNGQPDGDLVTSKTGACLVRLPEKEPSRLTVVARETGFAASRVFLRHEAILDQEIPRSYTLALHHATSVGGVVRDEEGRPIEGVELRFALNWARLGREDFVFDEVKVKTDAQGRWRAEFIPAGLHLRELHLSFEHPKYLGQSDAVNNNPIASPDRLREGMALTILRRGLGVTGRVVDVGNRPIPGALVRLGNRFNVSSRETKTDEAGRFQIENAQPGEYKLSIQMAGHSPAIKSVLVKAGLAPVEFRLEPGHTIRGRVVDRQGKPVAGAYVGVGRWRDIQTLDWRTETDAEGRFRWDGAPGDQVLVGAGEIG